jgi:quinolinate synthase
MPQIQFQIPPQYLDLNQESVFERIWRIKQNLGDDLLILGHHYQRDEVYQFADIVGDSLKLSQQAAISSAKYIVFCGVHFMAETADILTSTKQIVTLPDMRAGCPMADMAPIRRVTRLWEKITAATHEKIIPITYINSSAKLKAFCADHDGTVCTSTNAEKILRWALSKGDKILFLPDRHLGRNISKSLGIDRAEMIEVSSKTPDQEISAAKILLWQGHCPVHNKFTAEAVHKAKSLYPDTKLIAHPECPEEVFDLADFSGSTARIIEIIENAAPHSSWVIGTETHLVGRLQKRHTDKRIQMLHTSGCMCSMMDRISPEHLLWNLESIQKGEIINQVKVEDETATKARKALEIMLSLS